MERSDPPSLSVNLSSTLVSLDDLVATEGIDPRRVEHLEDEVTAVGGLLSPIQVIRLADGTYGIIDGHNREQVLRRTGSSLAWVQIHDPRDLRLATWLVSASADLAGCLTAEMFEVSSEKFESLVDSRGGLVAMGDEKDRFFLFPNIADLVYRLELQNRVIDSLIAANGNRRLERHEDDLRGSGPGWWKQYQAYGPILLVFPPLSAQELLEVIRRGIKIPAAATRTLIAKLRITDEPIPLAFLSRPFSADAVAELEHLLAERQIVVDRPKIDKEPAEGDDEQITPLRPLPTQLASLLDLPENCRMFIKDETVTGSSKARVAHRMLTDAAMAGKLKPETEVVLPSSGSTALALALETRKRNLKLTVFVPESISEGKLRGLRAHRHVAVIRVPGSSEDARRAADEYVTANQGTRPIWFADQYSDPSAARAHALTTAPEIVCQTHGGVTHVVAGMGTGATTTGLASVLSRLGVEVIGVQPADSKHVLAGLKHLPSLPAHLVPENAHPELLGSVEYVGDDEGLAFMRILVGHGLRFGPSTGAVLAAACRVASRLAGRPAIIVLIGHDSSDLYEVVHEVIQ
jgi:cysteine synthase